MQKEDFAHGNFSFDGNYLIETCSEWQSQNDDNDGRKHKNENHVWIMLIRMWKVKYVSIF